MLDLTGLLGVGSAAAESVPMTVRRMKLPESTPPPSPLRLSMGLTTPPYSGSKRESRARGRVPRESYTEYDHKLKVLDSQGRIMSRIVFRWWNANSQGLNSANQLRAGLYKSANSKIAPPLCGPKLQSAFLSHLTPEKRPSPFISTFESFLPALNRALKSERDAYISIIDLQEVERNSRERFPNAQEVIWPIKVVIKQYGFNLRNNYKGHEWLVHGIIEKSAIIQTVRVSDLRYFARTGRIRHMRDVLYYMGQQQHAFGLLDKLQIRLPKTCYSTGQLVGRVLENLRVPNKYRALLGRKINFMMRFEKYRNISRQKAFIKGVYNFDSLDSDSDSDGLDDFIVSSDEDYESDATYYGSEYRGRTRIRMVRDTIEDETSIHGDDYTSSFESDTDDEQALLDAQLHATEREWLGKTPSSKVLRMSHVEVPKLTQAQLAELKAAHQCSSSPIIDLTNDADDERGTGDDVIEVQPRTNEEDVMVIASATRTGRTMNLAIRSTSMKSTVGPKGLAKLEADAKLEVMEIMQFD